MSGAGFDLSGQRAVIVGGTSGIGLGIAQAAAAAGAEVVIAGGSRAKLDAALAEIGGSARGVPVDLTDGASVERLFADVGALDHLAVTAKPGAVGGLPAMTAEEVLHSLEGSFLGAYRCARAALPRMARDARSSITLISGGFGRRPRKGYTVLTVSHAACEALGRALAVEAAPVRANTLRPGLIDTPLYAGMDEAARQAMFRGFADAAPAGRVGRPDDLGRAAVWLMAGPFVTGSVVDVDGGSALI